MREGNVLQSSHTHMEKSSSVHSDSYVWLLLKSTENILETFSIMKVKSVLWYI